MRISVEANIGAGKTTLIRRLSEVFGDSVPMFLEPVEEWSEWLELFYTDPVRWGFTFNLNALMSFMRIHNNGSVISERSPLSCFNVFAELQKKQGCMTLPEYMLFKNIYDRIAWTPDIIIYLRTDPLKCSERMIKRARVQERDVSIEYLRAVHEQHEILITKAILDPTSLFGAHKHVQIITIDGNRDANTVFNDVVQQLRSII